jgi:hypothetical protein
MASEEEDIFDVDDVDGVEDDKYEYIPRLPNQPRICLEQSEIDAIRKLIPELQDSDFKKTDCDENQTYSIDETDHCCIMSNFSKAYTYFINSSQHSSSELIFQLPDKDIYDMKIFNSSKLRMFTIISINPVLVSLLRGQKDGEVIVANISIGERSVSNSVIAHHIVASFSKKEDTIFISIYDTHCQSDDYKSQFIDLFRKIYEYQVKINYNQNISFEFDNYVASESTHKDCDYNLQEYDSDLGLGFCVGWGLYFLHQIVIKKPSYQIYHELINIPTLSFFIYIWYDMFFHKVKESGIIDTQNIEEKCGI